jgi:hypothetical protein
MPIDMKALARAGAEARIRQLREEIAEIERAFPGLRGGSTRRFAARRGRPQQTEGASEGPARKRKRRAMSAAERKAVGERMKKYWAERKKQQGKK